MNVFCLTPSRVDRLGVSLAYLSDYHLSLSVSSTYPSVFPLDLSVFLLNLSSTSPYPSILLLDLSVTSLYLSTSLIPEHCFTLSERFSLGSERFLGLPEHFSLIPERYWSYVNKMYTKNRAFLYYRPLVALLFLSTPSKMEPVDKKTFKRILNGLIYLFGH